MTLTRGSQPSARRANRPAAQSAAQLRRAIRDALAEEFDRDTQFALSMRALAILVEENYSSITRGDPMTLGDKLVEVWCTVTNMRQTTFVIHKHPQSQGATPEHPWGSKLHLKPGPGNRLTPHIYRESIPEPVRVKIKSAIDRM